MTRSLKALGLAICAVAAMAAAVAPAAQAETGALTAAEYPAIITGAAPPGAATFDVGVAPLYTVSCGTADLTSTLAGPTDPVTFTPIYGECKAEPGALPVTVTTNGCDYRVGVTKPGTTEMPATTGTMQATIVCPPEQRVEIHIYENAFTHAANMPLCTYDIAPQGPVPAGVYHNVFANPNDVVATVKAAFTAKSTMGPEMVCGGGGALNHLPITLTGNYTLKGFHEDGGVEGMQIPIDVG
jgi:hypothetical protein